MKALGFYFQPRWASRPQVWTYRTRGRHIVTRRYRPTPSSRNRIARLARCNPLFQAEVTARHATVFVKSEIKALKEIYNVHTR